MLDFEVVGPVHFQHDASTIAELPLSVQVAAAAVRATTHALTIGLQKPEPAAHAAQVELAERTRAADDVAQRGAEVRLVPDAAGQPQSIVDLVRRAESLLDDRRSRGAGGPRPWLPGRGIQRRPSGIGAPQAVTRDVVLRLSSPGLVHDQPGPAEDLGPARHHQVDRRSLCRKAAETGDLERCVTDQGRGLSGVQQCRPHQLSPIRLGVVEEEHVSAPG